jgi:hypothetical protein
MIRGIALPIAVLGFALALVGCGTSTTPGTSPGSTVGGGITPPPGSGGGITPPPVGGGGTSNACSAFPTFNLQSPGPSPSFAQDTELLAKFPATIDGKPIQFVHAYPFLPFLCAFGTPGVDATGQVLAGLGINLATMTFGSFDTALPYTVTVNALRVPGADANVLLQNLAAIYTPLGQEPETTPLTTATVAGKTVYFRATGTTFDSEGVEQETRDYWYPSGDTLWSVDGIVESQANTIFAALP